MATEFREASSSSTRWNSSRTAWNMLVDEECLPRVRFLAATADDDDDEDGNGDGNGDEAKVGGGKVMAFSDRLLVIFRNDLKDCFRSASLATSTSLATTTSGSAPVKRPKGCER